MTTPPDKIAVNLRITSDNPQPDEIEAAIRRLKSELAQWNLTDVEHLQSQLPLGAKGAGMDFGALVITLAASGGVLTTLINAAQGWLTSNKSRKVCVEIGGDKIELTGSFESQELLIKAFIARHEKRPKS